MGTSTEKKLLVNKGSSLQESMVCQATVDSQAEMIALDTPTRNYLSGVLSYITNGPGHFSKTSILYALCREAPVSLPSGWIQATRDGQNAGAWVPIGTPSFGTPPIIGLFGSSGTNIFGPQGPTAFGPQSAAVLATGGSGNEFIAPRDGTVQNLRFSITAARGGANTSADAIPITVYVNDVATPITVSLVAGTSTASLSDTTHTVAVSAGDRIALVMDFTNVGDGNTIANFSISAELA